MAIDQFSHPFAMQQHQAQGINGAQNAQAQQNQQGYNGAFIQQVHAHMQLGWQQVAKSLQEEIDRDQAWNEFINNCEKITKE